MASMTELQQWLDRYPADRYPVQHATAQFHLGVALTDLGRLAEAAEALDVAMKLFAPAGLEIERAKATNARGAVFRLGGDLESATDTFRRASEAFAAADLPRDEGAALFNLGLVQRDAEEYDAAASSFRAARRCFDPHSAPAESAAAGRELGGVLLTGGELAEASEVLQAALPLAGQAGDMAGLGAVANLLGLVYLGDGGGGDPVAAFRDAAGAHPRSVRPAEHAMAKANLALAHERAGAPDHAYVAAAQALGIPEAAAPVRAQTTAVLERLGERPGAVHAVLDTEPADRWPVVVREELVRWADAEPVARRAECGGWVDGQLTRPAAADLAEAWLGGLLELPPESITGLVRATLEALAERPSEAAESFRGTVSRAVVRFPIPQWMRLKEIFNGEAARLGQETSWG